MRRFVVTRSYPYQDASGKRTTIYEGHWIGPGKASVDTLHKRIVKDFVRNLSRGRDITGKRQETTVQ